MLKSIITLIVTLIVGVVFMAIGNDFLLFDSGSRSKADYYVRYLTETSENKDFFQKPVKSKFFNGQKGK